MGQDQLDISTSESGDTSLPAPMPPELVTLEEFQEALPKGVRGLTLTQTMLDKVNSITSDPNFRDYYRDNIIGYTHVLRDGAFTIEQYLNAVRYVSFKVMGHTNIDSFRKAFPDKMTDYLNRGYQDKEIARYVSAYNKSKLVNLILEQTLVPVHVLNADLRQKAINQLASLMMTANSEKVQQESANSLLMHLKPPETTKIDIDIGVKQDSAIDALREATEQIVAAQRQSIEAGTATAKDVAQSKIIEGEAEVVE